MIGIVVVSHSHALAAAAIDLAAQMAGDEARPALLNAGGLDETTVGTDAAKVAAAIEEADSGDGVLVLLDLGSAVLSAEMALEFLDPELADRVRLTSAPLVEGLVAAVATGSGGADLATAGGEAADSLLAKREQLGDGHADPPVTTPDESPVDAATEVEVSAPHGLHARPAARLVALVQQFEADVRLRNPDSGRGPVPASSVTRVATLDARHGTRLRVEASGKQATEAVAAIEDLARTGFGDLPDADDARDAGPAQTSAPTTGSGLDVVLGVATVVSSEVDTSGYAAADPGVERERLAAAVDRAARELDHLTDSVRSRVGGAQAEIFQTHGLMLRDDQILQAVRHSIDEGAPAPQAWQATMAEQRHAFEALPDAYQRARAQDVTSLEHRVLAALMGEARPDLSEIEGVLVVDTLDPAAAGMVDAGKVSGIVTRRGGATGHGVIVARSRGIPVYTDAGAGIEGVRDGDVVAFDRAARELEVAPDDVRSAEFRRRVEAQARERDESTARANEAAVTTDGIEVEVTANVVSVAGARDAVAQGADGAGLVRTEILFGDRTDAPSADEQAGLLREVAQAFGGRRITVRTWDVGADKPLAFFTQPVEENPFLGARGIRAFRGDDGALVTQLEAICRLAVDHPVSVMFPMVTTRAEVQHALALVDRAAASVGGRPDSLRVGIMMEVPAAAIRTRTMTVGLDFVSIGTNDLTQYVTAAERGNAAVADLGDVVDPAVLQMVGQICREVPDGVHVAVCGDAAGDPLAARLLAGLGVRELSAPGPAVARVKSVLRRAAMADLEGLASRASRAASVADVHALLGTLDGDE